MTGTVTVPIRPEYDYAERLQLALFHRPDWAQSLALSNGTYQMLVTYSDSPSFGGTISQNVAYLERHGLKDIRANA